jgi:hypothetical protein
VGRLLDAQEFEHCFAKTLPRGLGPQQDVVAGVELDEVGVANSSRENAALRDRDDAIVPSMEDEGGRSNLRQQLRYIDDPAGLEERGRRRRRRCGPAEVVEPLDLFVGPLWNEA